MSANEWYRWKRRQLIEEYGGECQSCGETYGLEFAHVEPTACIGKGRGFNRRVADIMKNPCAYMLLCGDCHDSFDGRCRRKRQQDILKQL